MGRRAGARKRAGNVTVSCCQLAPAFGDPAANRELAADAVQLAAERGADVVVLPELATSGYVFREPRPRPAACAEAAGRPDRAPSGPGLADRAPGSSLVGGLCELTAAASCLQHAPRWSTAAGLRCRVPQGPPVGRGDARGSPRAARPPPVVATDGSPGSPMMICYDLEFPEWARLPALAGAQLLCAPTNWPRVPPAGRGAARGGRARRRPPRRSTGCSSRPATALGHRARRGLGRAARSSSIPDGWPLAEATAAAGPVTITAQCQLASALDKATGPRNNVHADRRPGLYRRVSQEDPPAATACAR